MVPSNPVELAKKGRYEHGRGRQGRDRIEQDQDVVGGVECFGEAFVSLVVQIGDGQGNGLCHLAMNGNDRP